MENERLIIHAVVDCRRGKETTYGYYQKETDAESALEIQLKRIIEQDLEGNPSKLPIERIGNLITFNNMRLLAIHSIVVQ